MQSRKTKAGQASNPMPTEAETAIVHAEVGLSLAEQELLLHFRMNQLAGLEQDGAYCVAFQLLLEKTRQSATDACRITGKVQWHEHTSPPSNTSNVYTIPLYTYTYHHFRARRALNIR